jgi:hypothetical protein
MNRSSSGSLVGVSHTPAATTFADLPYSDRRLGHSEVLAIIERGKTHNRLLERARTGIDTSEPVTRVIAKRHEAFRTRDRMPELNLPSEKLNASYQKLSELKWRMEWHERLIARSTTGIDTELPKHILRFQARRRREMDRLLLRSPSDKSPDLLLSPPQGDMDLG